MSALRVAVAQLAPSQPAVASLSAINGLVSEAADAGAGLIVFPEGVMHEFGIPGVDLAEIAEPLDGPWVSGLVAAAGTSGTTVLAGTWEATADRERARNVAVVVNGDGIVARYQKTHLFDSFGFKESDFVEPGPPETSVFELDGLRIGLSTCYDLRFPELYSSLAARGVDAICVIAGWVAGPGKVDHWETLLRARAIETTSYVIGSDLCGPRFAGHSGIWDPFGIQLVGAGDEIGFVTADLSSVRVAEVRGILPSLQHKRFGVAPATPR